MASVEQTLCLPALPVAGGGGGGGLHPAAAAPAAHRQPPALLPAFAAVARGGGATCRQQRRGQGEQPWHNQCSSSGSGRGRPQEACASATPVRGSGGCVGGGHARASLLPFTQPHRCKCVVSYPTPSCLHPPAFAFQLCCCRYITGDELSSVSSYMRSRLTADKCNAALDELAGLAEVGGWVRGWTAGGWLGDQLLGGWFSRPANRWAVGGACHAAGA